MKFIDLVGPNQALSIFGVKLVGVTAENGRKLLLTLLVLLFLWLSSRLLKRGIRKFVVDHKNARVEFWSNQFVNILAAILFVLGFLSIWFDDPVRLTTAFGLVSAGLAFALQKVITSFAGYVIILRGRLFNVGDRISTGRHSRRRHQPVIYDYFRYGDGTASRGADG